MNLNILKELIFLLLMVLFLKIKFFFKKINLNIYFIIMCTFILIALQYCESMLGKLV